MLIDSYDELFLAQLRMKIKILLNQLSYLDGAMKNCNNLQLQFELSVKQGMVIAELNGVDDSLKKVVMENTKLKEGKVCQLKNTDQTIKHS